MEVFFVWSMNPLEVCASKLLRCFEDYSLGGGGQQRRPTSRVAHTHTCYLASLPLPHSTQGRGDQASFQAAAAAASSSSSWALSLLLFGGGGGEHGSEFQREWRRRRHAFFLVAVGVGGGEGDLPLSLPLQPGCEYEERRRRGFQRGGGGGGGRAHWSGKQKEVPFAILQPASYPTNREASLLLCKLEEEEEEEEKVQ